MIRLATRWDMPQLVEMLRDFSAVSPLRQLQTNTNQGWVERQLAEIMAGVGRIWVDDRDGELAGTLIVIRAPSFWNPDVAVIQEVALWVKPQYRGATTAGRLMASLKRWSREVGLPVIFTTLPSSGLDLARSGFRVGETQWIGEF